MDLTSITPTPTQLKALTHPVRIRLLMLLRFNGPATSTMLATQIGQNTGATSYHLRQLEQHGFIEEDAERGDNRDRWWRAKHQSTHTHPERMDDGDARETFNGVLQAMAIVNTEQLQAAIEERPGVPRDWADASKFSDWGVRLTAAQAAELRDTLMNIIEGWPEAAPDAPDTAMYVVQLNAFPRPGQFFETL